MQISGPISQKHRIQLAILSKCLGFSNEFGRCFRAAQISAQAGIRVIFLQRRGASGQRQARGTSRRAAGPGPGTGPGARGGPRGSTAVWGRENADFGPILAAS